jgi:hypothetical protein
MVVRLWPCRRRCDDRLRIKAACLCSHNLTAMLKLVSLGLKRAIFGVIGMTSEAPIRLGLKKSERLSIVPNLDEKGIYMNFLLSLFIGLVFMAGSMVPSAAQSRDQNWAGEWGTFSRVPTTKGINEHYEGAGLSVTDCANQRCHLSFEILGKTFHAEAEGELMIESDSEAVARLGSSSEGKCTLAIDKTATERPSVTVRKRTGDCSYFATPGASFEQTYVLRSSSRFYGDDIPACFVGAGSAVVSLCSSRELAQQEHAWGALVQEVSDLGRPQLNKDTERARILKACDAVPDAATCLGTAFAKSTEELVARKDTWKASVTEPGDANEAKQKIEEIAGSYRHSFANGDVQGNHFKSTDTLEINRADDTSIRVDVHLEFYNGHECNHEGVASYRRAGFFAEQGTGRPWKPVHFRGGSDNQGNTA